MRMPSPYPTFRLIPSKFPPIGLFDTVARAADLEAVMELAGWTNDRLVSERVARLPRSEWVYGRPNASIVMAAFLHAAPSGGRFNGPDLGAWYAAADIVTSAAEVGHHLRREAIARQVPEVRRTFRAYTARLAGAYEDIRGSRPDVHASDDYSAGQALGETARREGSDGFLYDSVRRHGGTNIVAYRPSKVLDVTQAQHYEITVWSAERRIEIHELPLESA
jgi:hypothetical protein